MPASLRLCTFLLLIGLAGGCASFSPYSIDEETVEQNLRQQIEDFSRQQIAGAPFKLELERARVTLGPDDREVAVLDFAGQAIVDAFFAQVPVDISFKVEGAPVYDPEEKAVFIRELRLLESRVASNGNTLDLQPFAGAITDVASMFLDRHPVYRIDEDDFAQRMFSRMNMGIRVAPGRIVLAPGGRRDSD